MVRPNPAVNRMLRLWACLPPFVTFHYLSGCCPWYTAPGDSTLPKRIKDPFNHITRVHKALNIQPYHLNQCLFGEHLLTTDPKKPVAIVESEKTAIIAAGFIPDYLWLATAGKGNLNQEKLKPLHHRQVKLYPDLGACEKWQTIAASLPNVTVSTILEQRATLPDRTQGLDLADYLLDVHNPPL